MVNIEIDFTETYEYSFKLKKSEKGHTEICIEETFEIYVEGAITTIKFTEEQINKLLREISEFRKG